ncbi:hypothetical protein [Chthoniobacter sp.]|uniref:hypothetical protein n=1 Tax=Chthoniobacter sp. TaxID=2510640 RepID=UPI0032AFF3FE
MWSILIFATYRLAKREEAEVSRQFPEQYAAYKARVLTFVPQLSPQRKESLG